MRTFYGCQYSAMVAVKISTYSTSSSAWTLDMPWTRAIPSLIPCQPICSSSTDILCVLRIAQHRNIVVGVVDIPDGQDTAGLGEASLLLDTADSLLEDRGDLSWGGLSLGVGAGLNSVEGSWGNSSGLEVGRQLAESPEKTQTAARQAPKQLPTIIMYRKSISIELR